MKLVIVLSVLALVAVAAATNSTWGYRGPYDILLHQEIVKKSSSFLQVSVKDVRFPSQYQKNNRTITAIRVTDQLKNGKGGYAQLYGGGVGFNHTLIHFKSLRSEGFLFVLEIFGRR